MGTPRSTTLASHPEESSVMKTPRPSSTSQTVEMPSKADDDLPLRPRKAGNIIFISSL